MDKTMKVTVDGIELEVKISEEELAKLTKGKEPKKTGYERVDCSQEYCVVGSDGRVECLNELGTALIASPISDTVYVSSDLFLSRIASAISCIAASSYNLFDINKTPHFHFQELSM